jgi:hypothetical protein
MHERMFQHTDRWDISQTPSGAPTPTIKEPRLTMARAHGCSDLWGRGAPIMNINVTNNTSAAAAIIALACPVS